MIHSPFNTQVHHHSPFSLSHILLSSFCHSFSPYDRFTCLVASLVRGVVCGEKCASEKIYSYFITRILNSRLRTDEPPASNVSFAGIPSVSLLLFLCFNRNNAMNVGHGCNL